MSNLIGSGAGAAVAFFTEASIADDFNDTAYRHGLFLLVIWVIEVLLQIEII